MLDNIAPRSILLQATLKVAQLVMWNVRKPLQFALPPQTKWHWHLTWHLEPWRGSLRKLAAHPSRARKRGTPPFIGSLRHLQAMQTHLHNWWKRGWSQSLMALASCLFLVLKHFEASISILIHFDIFWYYIFSLFVFFPTDNGEECSQVLPSCHLWYIAFLSNVAASHIFPHSDWYKNNQEYTRSIKINGMVLCGSTMFYHKLQYISVYYIVLLYDMLWSLCCDLHSQSVSHWFTKHHRTIQNHTKPIKSWSVFCTSIGTVGSPDFSSLPSIILHPRFSNRRMTNFKFLAVFFTLQSSSSCQLVWMRWH